VIPAANAQAIKPSIFFTDLVSAPNSGGQQNLGAFVTVVGRDFGSSRGSSTVTVGGGAVAAYPLWSSTKIIVQLGPKAVTGPLVVNVAGSTSNSINFTVRTGRIFFVSTAGSDAAAGTFSAPFATLRKAISTVAAGDVVYAMTGVQQTSADAYNSALTVSKAGTSALPITLAAYPNAKVTVGNASGATYGIRVKPGTAAGNWIISGLLLRGYVSGVAITNSSNWRLVGNDIYCPNGYGTGACLSAEGASGLKLLGNAVHDAGSSTATDLKFFQGVNIGTSNSVDVGWNEIARVRGCRGIQFYSDTGTQHGLSVHDNYIHDVRCDGINFSTVDASLGTVQAYNNVIARAGTGPAPGGIESNYACVNVGGGSAGTVKIRNNTMQDCGARKSADSGAVTTGSLIDFSNNIVSLTSGENYVGPNTSLSLISGPSNLFTGGNAATAGTLASVKADPKFMNPTAGDFHLQPGSPAIDKGSTNSLRADRDGMARPQGAAFDIGAYEYVGSTSSSSGQLSSSPGTFTFGTVPVGGSSTQSGSLSNTGTASLTISQASVTGSGFSISGLTLPLALAPSQVASYNVRFAPASAASVTGAVTFSSNAANTPATVSLAGTGASQSIGTLAAAPTSLAFGNVAVGSSSTKALTLTNTGTANVSITSSSLSGSGFSASNLPSSVLNPGASITLQITFAPSAAASSSGTLLISSNASNPSLSIALSGTGTSVSVSHSVDLSWGASTPAVSGYNIYRSAVSGGPYSKVNSALIAGTAFTDATIQAGTTYYYVVRGVSSAGVESLPSNEVQVVTPTP